MGQHVKFDQTAYISAFKKSVEGAFDKVTEQVYKAMMRNLAELKVRQVDAVHKDTFPSALKRTNNHTSGRLMQHFFMNNSGKNDSFRALYYEYGTGVNMRPPAKWSPSDDPSWNSVRPKQPGAKIYYRDKPWTDLGGNRHKAAVKPGVKLLIPRKNIYGHPVQAQFWFKRGLYEGTSNMDELILQAVKSVPITAYIKIRDVRVRM